MWTVKGKWSSKGELIILGFETCYRMMYSSSKYSKRFLRYALMKWGMRGTKKISKMLYWAYVEIFASNLHKYANIECFHQVERNLHNFWFRMNISILFSVIALWELLLIWENGKMELFPWQPISTNSQFWNRNIPFDVPN